MTSKHIFLILIYILIFQLQSIGQADNEAEKLPDLTFAKTIEANGENEPIDIKITVINSGEATSKPAVLSINATYRSVTESDIKRLNLELVESDLSFDSYEFNYDIPVLKPNETATFNFKLDKKLDDDCYFLIRVDRENKVQESNIKNNKTAFPEQAFGQFNIFPDLVVKTIHEPEYNYDNKSTILIIDIENIGFATAENVTLEAWEITTAIQGVSERDLQAIFGENWWLFQDENTTEPMFEFSETIKELKAGEQKSFFIEFPGWIYNPNCKIGANVKTTSVEDNTYNNASSFLQGG